MRIPQTILPFLLLLLLPAKHWAQQEADASPLRVQVSTGVQVGKGLGDWQSMQWIAPSLRLQATPRLTVMGGLASCVNLLPEGVLKGNRRPEADLAPRRTGTNATAMWMAAAYQATDRLWLWGAISHTTGYMQPLWSDRSFPIGATTYSGGLAWEVTDNHLLEFHFHFTHDPYGTAPLSPYAAMGHGFAPASPFSCYGSWPW